MVQMGTYKELLTTSTAFSRLLDNIYQQHEQEYSNEMKKEHATTGEALVESDNEEEPFFMEDDVEAKEKGTVKWHVYVRYLRAGAGLTIGLVWLIAVYTIREFVSIVASRWLAEWSEDGDYQHSQLKNCTGTTDQKINKIQSMTDAQWNKHRDNRFYFYCGLTVALVIFTLLRTLTVRYILLNASRVLHNK